jgi:hypothetical protein
MTPKISVGIVAHGIVAMCLGLVVNQTYAQTTTGTANLVQTESSPSQLAVTGEGLRADNTRQPVV